NNSFTVNPENLTIPQNDSVEITVTFSPGTAAEFNDTLLIYSNASVHPDTITLSGTGTSETTAPIIALSAGTINFPDITINSSISRSIYIKNNGNAPLVINSITSDNSEFTVDSTNFSVPAADSHKVTVTFRPTEDKNYGALLIINHNAEGNPDTLILNGRGVSNQVAIFGLSVSSINFPSVTVNSSIQRSFYIRNEGTANLQISNISSNDTSFKVDLNNFTVPPQDSHKVTITFIPTQAKNYDAVLTIVHNASGSPAAINLTGNGTISPVAIFDITKTALNFGTLFTGSSSSQFLYIRNEGVANLNVTQINSSDNAYHADTSNFTLTPGDSLKVTVSFHPTEAKLYNASLSIQHNAAGSPAAVSLTGTGFSYPANISLSVNQSFGSVDNSNNFKIVGVPGNSSIPVQMSGNFDYDWSVYWDNGSEQNYLEHKSDFTFTPGKAYWVIGKNPLTITQQVNSVPINSNDFTYSILLHSGWNLISNPFERAAQWSSIRNLNSLPANKLLYSWNGSWSNSSEMKPYEGYYFYNDSTNLPSLKIPYEINGSLGKMNDDYSLPVNPEKFLKIAVLGSKELELSGIFIGIDPGASDGIDEKDYFSPPGDFQKQGITLLRNELPKREKYLFIEQRPAIGEGQDYTLEIKTVPNLPLEIKIDGLNNFKDYNIYLFDAVLKNLYNIKDKQKIEYKSAHQYNPFKLFIGTDNYINEIKNKLLPITHQLYQNYPNPFNPRTVIRFSLPETEKISIRVFNILGELVSTLIDNQVFDAGSYEVEFNGSQLSSGVYIAALEAPGFNAQKKMILLK
ncbi:MAG: choice-of-anchor D domain-containing protein, partial [Ignavibacteria bacterium]